MQVCVVGSGVAGVSVSLALLRRGYKVTMLDYGNEISSERAIDVAMLAKIKRHEWNNALTDKIKYTVHQNLKNKLAYGEDFPYRDGITLSNIMLQNCTLYPSLAIGGLSNIWGGAVLPYISKDIQDWPITIEDLVPYYKEIGSLITISQYHDDDDQLVKDYPLYSNEKQTIHRHVPKQILQFYRHLHAQNTYYKKNNVSIGYARNAYNAEACINCALCMWGCPLDLIYNSKQTLDYILKSNPQFTYIGNVLVKTFRETDNSVQIIALDKETKTEREYSADKLFLAAGVLSTAKIVLSSLKSYNPVYMKDTPYFVAPLIDFKLKGDCVTSQDYNTLSQLFKIGRAHV